MISAGAILYEATFGKAPFATDSLLTLMNKIRNEKIFWPSKIADRPDCTVFLQGLLEKDPKKRIIWSDIYEHVYLSSSQRIIECQKECQRSEKGFTGFTMPLTESQELAKEIQRQDKAKKLQGGTLITIAQKYEEMKNIQKINNGRRYSDMFPVPYQPPAPLTFQPVQNSGIFLLILNFLQFLLQMTFFEQ